MVRIVPRLCILEHLNDVFRPKQFLILTTALLTLMNAHFEFVGRRAGALSTRLARNWDVIVLSRCIRLNLKEWRNEFSAEGVHM